MSVAMVFALLLTRARKITVLSKRSKGRDHHFDDCIAYRGFGFEEVSDRLLVFSLGIRENLEEQLVALPDAASRSFLGLGPRFTPEIGRSSGAVQKSDELKYGYERSIVRTFEPPYRKLFSRKLWRNAVLSNLTNEGCQISCILSVREHMSLRDQAHMFL